MRASRSCRRSSPARDRSIATGRGGAGETITSTGFSVFNSEPRLALEAFNAGYIDIRGKSSDKAATTIIGNVAITALSSFRMRDNTMTGDVDVGSNSTLGIRNSVILTGTVTCDASVVEFSNNGTPKC